MGVDTAAVPAGIEEVKWLTGVIERQPAAGPMLPPDDRLYFAALAAAMGVLEAHDDRPPLARHEWLAVVTFAILDAIKQAELLQSAD